MYRLFDKRYTFNSGQVRGFLAYPKRELSAQFTQPNLALLSMRQLASLPFAHAVVSDMVPEQCSLSAKTKEGATVFHLYDYPLPGTLNTNRTPNLDRKLYAAICAAAQINPADQAGPDDDFRAASGDARPSEVKVFDYIYGVLHSPDYRKTFAEFLKIEFPRIPYPPSPEVFAHVSDKGEQLRRLHLMEEAAIGDAPYTYLGEGDDVVASGYPKFDAGKVHINPDQHFAHVPEVAWSFPIGGYQPAQKWLKDRRGRSLSWDDVGHYQKIIKILCETDRIMKEIKLPITSEATAS